MELALNFCTHVVYSYATITEKEFVLTVHIPERKEEFAHMKQFKKKFPKVKFLLSVSGETTEGGTKRFLNLLKSSNHEKMTFIKSVIENLLLYDFDGLSLDFPLPIRKSKPKVSLKAEIWENFINLFKKHSDDDDNSKEISQELEYRDQLTTLIQKLSINLRERKGIMALNILPLVDSQSKFVIIKTLLI